MGTYLGFRSPAVWIPRSTIPTVSTRPVSVSSIHSTEAPTRGEEAYMLIRRATVANPASLSASC